METLFLTLDTVAVIVLLYFSYKGEKSGNLEQGPFRIRQLPIAPAPAERPTLAERNAGERRRRR